MKSIGESHCANITNPWDIQITMVMGSSTKASYLDAQNPHGTETNKPWPRRSPITDSSSSTRAMHALYPIAFLTLLQSLTFRTWTLLTRLYKSLHLGTKISVQLLTPHIKSQVSQQELLGIAFIWKSGLMFHHCACSSSQHSPLYYHHYSLVPQL